MILSEHLHRLREDQRGTVAVIMGLLIVPLVGVLGVGFEVSNWYMTGQGAARSPIARRERLM
jgi:Flp pilus assembly protein TadG